MSDRSTHSFDWGAFRAHLATFIAAVILCALIVGVIIGTPVLHKQAATLAGGHNVDVYIRWPAMRGSTPQTIADTDLKDPALRAESLAFLRTTPTWLPEHAQEDLVADVYRALGSTPDPFSVEPLQRAAQAMVDSGWFAGTPTLVRGPANTVRIVGTWRVPILVIRWADEPQPSVPGGSEPTPPTGQDFLASADVTRLPIVYPAGKSGLPVLVNVEHPPPTKTDGSPDYANAWQGEDVKAGAELLALLLSQPYGNQIAGIDLKGFVGSQSLVVLTTHNTRIVWGGPVSKPRPGEGTTEHKLGRLQQLNAEFGRIDGGYAEVEIWWPIDRPIVISAPLATEAEVPLEESPEGPGNTSDAPGPSAAPTPQSGTSPRPGREP